MNVCMLVKSYFISCIDTLSEDAQCGTKKAILNACRDIGGAGKDTASETKKKSKEGEPWWGREWGWMLVSQTTDYDQWSDEKDNTEHTKDTYCSESAHLCAGRLKKGQKYGMSCIVKNIRTGNEKVRVAIGNQGCWTLIKAYEWKSHIQIIKRWT